MTEALELFSGEKRTLWGDPVTLYSYVKGSCSKVVVFS